MTILKGYNFQEQSIPFESLQPFINGRVWGIVITYECTDNCVLYKQGLIASAK